MIELHTLVALLEDLPQHGLKRGHMGTVVEQWADDVYEVEFADRNGVTHAMVALRADQLLVLREYTGLSELPTA